MSIGLAGLPSAAMYMAQEVSPERSIEVYRHNYVVSWFALTVTDTIM